MAAIRTTISSRDLDEDLAGAKNMAEGGPVFVVDRGRPAFVLMTDEAFVKMGGKRPTLLDMIADPRPEADFEFEIERSDRPEHRFVDFETDRWNPARYERAFGPSPSRTSRS